MTFKTIFGRTAFLAAALALFLTTASEARAACSDPAGPGVDWSGCDKSGADLYEAKLNGADLSGANLSNATLIWSDLTRANLSSAYLDYANLSGADLSGANLYQATLPGTNLTGAKLSGATWYNQQVCAEGSTETCK